ncbi:hypothetical protein Aph01nite_54500 [Acrocarpospora phusangensis]|uniref:CAAX prenyl protease 2/Lysostaphin resistance protein A-like domain-containing protein n=1 Tax=Acrocarpospora phusangensis TaxID=1070424 RepID=A0A919UT61_9ACTN|nr:CPBP family intramembrane glutamic endopeptidase [Acrocarpospora phusangensis]GIH27140.1 hypothetical protein Aph01nite_54500 [Acrocarpospora phusangensis]
MTAKIAERHPETLTWARVLTAHLLPGIALTGFWLACTPLLIAAGLPPLWGLLAGVIIVLLPVTLLTMRKARNQLDPGRSLVAFAGIRRLRGRDLLRVGVPALLTSLVASGAVIALEVPIRTGLFGWLPAWWTTGPQTVDTVTLVLWFVSAVVVGPVLEEAYFRGYLQPRIPGGPLRRCLIGSVLFTVYHLWQPYAWITILATTVPIALSQGTRSGTTIPIVVHVLSNLVVFILLIAGTVTR